MPKRLRPHHLLLLLIILPINLLLFLTFGWSLFCTITERSGLNGSMYFYYNLTKLQFCFYTAIISITGMSFIIYHAQLLIRKKSKMLSYLYWHFAVYVIVVIVCEVILETRFVGKAWFEISFVPKTNLHFGGKCL